VNNTFYRLPEPEVFAGWKRQASPGFLFAIKANRFLTHRKKLKDPQEPLQNLLDRCRRLGSHRGPILYQLPPYFPCNVERLRAFIRLLPRRWSHVFEFRDPSWYTDAVRDLLTETGMAFCIHDLRGQPCPPWVTGKLAYVRFHGPTEQAYAGSYSEKQLKLWAERIDDFRQAGHDVYAYFNNDISGHAIANARRLRTLLGVSPPADEPAPKRRPARKVRS
jgi:uncharacterized protein YecE (DUF72 family)